MYCSECYRAKNGGNNSRPARSDGGQRSFGGSRFGSNNGGEHGGGNRSFGGGNRFNDNKPANESSFDGFDGYDFGDFSEPYGMPSSGRSNRKRGNNKRENKERNRREGGRSRGRVFDDDDEEMYY